MPRQPYISPISFSADLPITAHLPEVREALQKHQVIVVAGETGSGKTTQLPKLMLALGRGVEKLIGHTQPRRIAARSVAERLAEELKTSVGDVVGYQVRFHHQANEETYIKVMTDGILLAELSQDRLLKRYDTLIIDEAHERSLNIDFILGYLKWVLPKRPDLKIIITSATLDHERFSSHFDDCPVIEVSGRGYPVEIHYQSLNDGVEFSEATQAHEILRAVQSLSDEGDILVFLSGERDIRQANDFLRKSKLRHTEILPLFSKLSAADQHKIFYPSGLRRIILSTNVAETSLTIPNIKYVIDTGLARIKRYSYRSKIQRLPIEPISKASAKQRAGRCGRTSPGICVRLYSEQDFNLREDYTEPEILRSNLANVILQMLSLRLGDPEKFPWLDAPESQYWKDAYQCLEELRAIEFIEEKYCLTETGKQLARLPLDPRLGKMLLTAQQKNCVELVLIIVAALSIPDIFQRPMDKRQAADEAHKLFFDVRSDFLTYLNLWHTLHEIQHHESNTKLRQFCEQHFLSYLKFREWQDMVSSLRGELQIADSRQKKPEVGDYHTDQMTEAEVISIHQSILSGILSHVAMNDVEGKYLATRNRYVKIFPGSALCKKQPPWIMAIEFMETQQVFARTVAGIDSAWIESLAPHLIKKTYSDPHWDARRGEVLASERVLFFGLSIVQKRRVRYAPIDPALAHEVFVREALAQRQLNSSTKFWQHNEKFLNELEDLEERRRSRHFVPDEDWLYVFYVSKIPEEICNRVDLEKWVRALQPANLMLSAKDLENEKLKDQLNAFPSEWLWQGNKLKLSYQFSPGSAEDGVTLELPLPLLPAMQTEAFDCLVPGFLEQKISAILKALPKENRKLLMPLNETVAHIFSEISEGGLAKEDDIVPGKNFYRHLSRMLQENFGLVVSVESLVLLEIPDFLKFNFKLIDDGKIIAMSRNLEELKKKFSQNKAEHAFEGEEVYKDWPDQHLPEQIQVQAKYLKLIKFLGLSPVSEGVQVITADRLEQAKSQHRLGVAELLRLKCADTIDYVIKKMLVPAIVNGDAQLLKNEKFRDDRFKGIQQVWKKLAPILGDWEAFMRDFSYALTFMTFAEDFWFIRDVECFETLYAENYQDLLENANALVPVMQAMITQLLKLKLKGKALNDFAHLFEPGFLREVSWEWLERYPAYLAALVNGVEKLTSVQEQSLHKLTQLAQKKACDESTRFLMEEYRASLYLPAFRAVETVSEARLLKLLKL